VVQGLPVVARFSPQLLVDCDLWAALNGQCLGFHLLSGSETRLEREFIESCLTMVGKPKGHLADFVLNMVDGGFELEQYRTLLLRHGADQEGLADSKLEAFMKHQLEVLSKVYTFCTKVDEVRSPSGRLCNMILICY